MAEKKNVVKKFGLDAVLENISKSVGIDSKSFRRYDDSYKIECLPTTIPELDAMLGIGGIPWGTIVEFFGPEQSGKTWLAYILAASCQAAKLPVLYLDAEGTLNPFRAKAVGVDPFNPELFIWKNEFDSGNQALDIVDLATQSGEFGIIVVDSVASLIPKEEMENSLTKNSALGLHARMMSRALPKIADSVKNKKTIVVFINQIRSGNLGSFMGASEETTGGKALKFYSHVRIRLQARKAKDSKIIDKNKRVIGNMTQCRLIKTRYGMPFEECDFPIYFVERERDPFLEFFTFAERRGLMKFSNKYYRFPVEETTIKAKEIHEFRDMLLESGELINIAKELGFDDPEQVVAGIVLAAENEVLASEEFEDEDDFMERVDMLPEDDTEDDE